MIPAKFVFENVKYDCKAVNVVWWLKNCVSFICKKCCQHYDCNFIFKIFKLHSFEGDRIWHISVYNFKILAYYIAHDRVIFISG